MKGKRLIGLIMALVVGTSLIISACAPAAPAPEAPPEVPEVPIEEPETMAILGGTIGGTANLKANLAAGILRDEAGVRTTVLIIPTMAQPDALREGVGEINATIYSYVARDVYTGTGLFADQEPFKEFRILFPAEGTKLLIHVTKDSGITTFDGLVGKRVSAGVKGLVGEAVFCLVAEALGYDSVGDFDRVYLGHSEAASGIIAGTVATHIVTMSPPAPAQIVEADLRVPITLVGLSDEQLATIVEHVPGASIITIPPDYYHMDEPIKTLMFVSCMGTTTRLPEELGYAIAKTWIENPEITGYFHSSFPTYVTEGYTEHWIKTLDLGAPWHIGVYKYFQERGWSVHPSMIPPEAK